MTCILSYGTAEPFRCMPHRTAQQIASSPEWQNNPQVLDLNELHRMIKCKISVCIACATHRLHGIVMQSSFLIAPNEVYYSRALQWST